MKWLSNFRADGTITVQLSFFIFLPPCNFVAHMELHKTLKLAACDGNVWCKGDVWLPSLLRAHTRRWCWLQNILFYCWIKEWCRTSFSDLQNTGQKSVLKHGNTHFWIYETGIIVSFKSPGICQLASVKALKVEGNWRTFHIPVASSPLKVKMWLPSPSGVSKPFWSEIKHPQVHKIAHLMLLYFSTI